MKRVVYIIERVNKMRGDAYEAAKDAVMTLVCVDLGHQSAVDVGLLRVTVGHSSSK